MGDTGQVMAVDKTQEKTGLLSGNLKRLGITNTRVVLSDASRPGFLKDIPEAYFDRIMVDAPCTALGTIAKNPEVKYNRGPDDVERLSRLSVDIMSACHPYLKPGGRMMFYTCTLSPVENGQAVREFIRRMQGRYFTASAGGTEMEMDIMPYYLNSEGGYVCVLEKK
jgi:16S rRNA (cytosine967-C5)-methyltransferase